MDKQEEKIVWETVETLFHQLGIDGTFTLAKGGEEAVEVVLETKDTGVVIGYHGATLEALQLVLSLLVSKKLNRFVRVSLEVGDYKKQRTDYLENLALSAKEKVMLERKEFFLPSLRPWERRIVHLLLQDDEEVFSESVGEGKERTLVIRPRS